MSNPPPPYPGYSSNHPADGKSQPPPPDYQPPSGYGYGSPPPGPMHPPGVYGPPPGVYGHPPGVYRPPPGVYGPPPGASSSQSVVVVNQPRVTVVQMFGEISVPTYCPHCNSEVMTAAKYEDGTFTWLMCFLVCVLGCNLGCCLIPFCTDGCKDVVHSCPSCNQVIGRYNRL